jgi:ABC-2 type transport system ATP-binding protein
MTVALEQIAEPRNKSFTPTQSEVASLCDVTKRYSNGIVALEHLSLELQRGEIVVLLGPNGAGKSTAVKLMMGLTSPNSGRARIFGADPRFAANRQRTGVMLQVGRAPEMLRVREHIEIMRGYYPRPLPFAEIVRGAGLEGLESRMFGQLSGGQKQRVLFALAIAGDADLIFLDEPTAGLDVEARRGMWAQIRSLKHRGKTVLLTTHYLEEADALADRMIVINKGRVVCEGTPNEIKAMGSGATALTAAPKGEASPVPVTGVKLLRFETTLTREQILTLTGVARVDGATGFITVTSSAPELTLRELLALDPELSGLEIQTPALEDAFLALTARD